MTEPRSATHAEVKAVGSTGEKFSMSELGVPENKAKLIRLISEAPKAGMIYVSRYESKNGHGEVADFFYLKGIDYGNMKKRSIVKLVQMETNKQFSITVNYDAWVNATGEEFNRKASDRTLQHREKTYRHGNRFLNEAFAKVHQSLESPRPATTEYDKHGNGIYEYESTLHIRDCLLIAKTVVRQGDYPQSATSELVAIADAIKALLPISKYRQVRLDGRFDYITIGGQLVMQSEGGTSTYVGFKEHAGNVESRIVANEDRVEQEREVPDSIREAIEDLNSEPTE